MPSSPQWAFAHFRVDLDHACLWHGAEAIALPPKIFDLLHYFVTHPDRVISKEELLEAVWPETTVTDAVVRVAIGALRKALGDTTRTPQFIATVSRRGYRFLAPLMTLDAPEPVHPKTISQDDVPTLLVPETGSPEPAEPLWRSHAPLADERKQVTVLFAEITGAMEIIRDLDPEAAQHLLDPALHAMIEAVHRYEGTVNQVLSDGIMALFGAPIAHEEHTLRACYAALAMQAALRTYAEVVCRTHSPGLQCRIGLNTGEVVVRTIHDELQQHYSAVGLTTSLAARLGQAAPPDTILLTTATAQLTVGQVRVKAWGPMPIQGLGEPVEVWELLGSSGQRRRLQSARARGLTPFVGRQLEMTILHTTLAQASTGYGQVVAVVGEVGVGKSRLVDEFMRAAHDQGWLVLDSAAVSYSQGTPYFPICDLLRRYMHLEEDHDTHVIQARVMEQTLALDAALNAEVPALLALFEALPADSPFLHLDPRQRRQQTFAALKRVWLRQSQEQPVLLVIEDLHWLDTETQAFLESLVESLPRARMLLLINYRPDYRHGWGSKTYYTQVRLAPLPAATADVFLRELLGNDRSLALLIPVLIQRTEGNPFFLEESVRTLVETGVLVGEPGAYRVAHALPPLHIPATVQAVLAARIDRLPTEEKRLLQTAAVIGPEFSLSLLQALEDRPMVALRQDLAHLQQGEFLHEARLFPDLAYTFKHALTQDVAYGSLLQERRRALHARIVEALEALAGGQVAEQIERLVHHALRGEVWDKALVYCRQAGEKALRRSAHLEAVGYFEQALSVLPHLPETRDTREQAIDLRLALRTALFPSGDVERMLSYLYEAEALAVASDDTWRLGQISIFLSAHFCFEGAYDQAIVAGQRTLALATARGDVVLHALANQYIGMAYHAQGDYHRAIDCLGQTVASFQGVQSHERFGQVNLPVVLSRAWLAWCHTELGMFAVGRTLGEEGRCIAEAVEHPSSLALASWGIGLLALRQGDLPRALPLLGQAMRLCQEADLALFIPWMAAILGLAYTLSGRVADAMPLLTQAKGLEIAGEIGVLQVLRYLSLGEAQMRLGHLEDASALAAYALTRVHRRKERGHQAYATWLLGEIAARHDPPQIEQAEAYYATALALAEALGMHPLQAHCHRALGVLYGQRGYRQQARAALSTGIKLYRAMDMTFWLPQTEAALTQASVK